MNQKYITKRQMEKPIYERSIKPYVSLSAKGFYVLMGLVSFFCLSVGLVFSLSGAWPVFGFLGLDVLIIFIAFRASYRAGQVREELQMTLFDLTVKSRQPEGTAETWTFKTAWMTLHRLDAGLDRTKLVVESEGQRLEFGAFLNEPARDALFKELVAAHNKTGAQKR